MFAKESKNEEATNGFQASSSTTLRNENVYTFWHLRFSTYCQATTGSAKVSMETRKCCAKNVEYTERYLTKIHPSIWKTNFEQNFSASSLCSSSNRTTTPNIFSAMVCMCVGFFVQNKNMRSRLSTISYIMLNAWNRMICVYGWICTNIYTCVYDGTIIAIAKHFKYKCMLYAVAANIILNIICNVQL